MERLQFYYTAGHTLERLESEEGLTVKAAVLNDPKVYDKKRTYALIAETLQCKDRSLQAVTLSFRCHFF